MLASIRPHRGKATASGGGFLADENGAVFLELLIVLFPYMFILFGAAQAGLISMASFYVNYANFMALRTASVQYEMFQDDFISEGAFKDKCLSTAAAAMGPIEPFLYHHPTDIAAKIDLRSRLNFIYEEGSQSGADGRAVVLEGRLEYDYPLIVPFAGNVIAALGKDRTPADSNRVMHDFVSELGPNGITYPSLMLRSSDDISADAAGGGSPPFSHEMLVQRRWLYN